MQAIYPVLHPATVRGAAMIRPASFLDIPSIINLGNRYVEEEVKKVAHHCAVWDAETSAHFLCQSLTSSDMFLWVAVDDGELVGFLWAATHPMAPWNPAMVASDMLFYVVPEKRGSLIGMRLVKEYKAWAESMACVEVRLSIASGINEERVGRMFNRLGFETFGTVYNHKF
jgi:GNAT superfamily N-acetyltransferase